MSAQDLSNVKLHSFGLEQYVSHALEYCTDSKTAKLKKEIVKTNFLGMDYYRALLPNISFKGSMQYYFELPKTPIGSDFANILNGGKESSSTSDKVFAIPLGTTYSGTLGLKLDQILFSWEIFLKKEAKNIITEFSELEYNSTIEDLVVNLKKTYYNAMLLEHHCEVLADNNNDFEELLSQSKKLFANGIIDQIELKKIQLTFQENVNEFENICNLKKISFQLLKNLGGIELKDSLILTDNFSELIEKVDINLKIQNEALSLTNNNDYLKLRNAMKGRQMEEDLAFSKMLPNLHLNMAYNVNIGSDNFSPIFSPEKSWLPNSFIGVTLNAPLFSGFSLRLNRKAKRLEVESLDLILSNTENQIRIQIQDLFSQLQNLWHRYSSNLDNLKLFKEITDLTYTKYINGTTSSSEFLNAKMDERGKELLINSFQLKYLTTYDKYLKLAGKLIKQKK